MLRQLETKGLVALVPDPSDGRRRRVTLTLEGQQQWEALDSRSQQRTRDLLEPLPEDKRAWLAMALSDAELLLRAATVTMEDADPASHRAEEAIGRYFAELRDRFGFIDSGLDAHEASALRPPHGIFVLAISDGESVACGAVQTLEPSVGEIKRMWVSASWRGAGLGSRL